MCSDVDGAHFSAKLREKPENSVKAGIFGGNRAGLEWKCAVGGWVTAQRYGKLRVRLSFCMWVGMVAAFAFELRRILGRTVRIFRQNRAKKPKFSAKTVFSAGIGRDWGGIAPWWASSGAGRW